MRLGIDFGTTRTVVAYADRGNYPVLSFHDNAGDAIDFFPSVAAERDGELRFGFDALAVASDSSWTVLRSFKRLLAETTLDHSYDVALGGSLFTAREIVTRFLRALAVAIRTRSNLPEALRGEAGGALEAVVASPANAHGTQRFLTLESFRDAGFRPLAMLNEPSAAGFEYTHRHRDTFSSRREHVVVYDLGGGTFDASLVHMRGVHHEAVITSGINRLGGDDFDDVLLELVLKAAHLSRPDVEPHALALLLDQCRDAKERLSPTSRKIALDLEAALGAAAPAREVIVPVADFYEACGFLVDRTVETMLPVIAGLEREAPGDPARPLADIAGIYVVGGASELPLIARALRQRFGRRVHRSPYPGAATAIGLAIAADAAAHFTLSDKFSRNFGLFREASSGSSVAFDHVFAADTQLPGPGEPPVFVRREYRAAHNVGHYRYFECAAVDAHGTPSGRITPSGEFRFAFDAALRDRGDLASIPVRRISGEGPRVLEEYAADPSGVVHVRLRDLDDGYEKTFRLPDGAMP